jgi:multidrug resistance protein, MATE family
MFIQLGTTALHPLWCYLLVNVWELGIRGPAIAQSVSQVLNMVVLSLYLQRVESFKETWFWPDAACFRGLWNYCKIGLNTMGVIWLEWVAFEFLTFITGFLDVDSTGAQIILFNFECLIFMPAMTMQIACAAKVGKSIGANNVPLAKLFATAS